MAVHEVWWQCTRCGGSARGVVAVQEVWWQCTRCGGSVGGVVAVQEVWWQCTRCGGGPTSTAQLLDGRDLFLDDVPSGLIHGTTPGMRKILSFHHSISAIW